MTPMPPCWAMAMASRDSVTVSMAALTSGTLSADVAREAGRDVHLGRAAPASAAAPAARRRRSAPSASSPPARQRRPVSPRVTSMRRPVRLYGAPWHFLYFLPLPHGHGSLRPTFGSSRRTVLTCASSPPVRGGLRRAGPSGRPRPGAEPKNRAPPRCGALRTSWARRAAAAGRRTRAAPPSSAVTGAATTGSGPSPRRCAPSCPGRARSSPSCTRPADRAGRSRAGRCLPSGGRGCRGGPSTARRRSAA